MCCFLPRRKKNTFDGSKYGVVLTPIIVSRLPEEVRMEWARKSAGKEAELEFLLLFLKGEIESRERSQSFGSGGSGAETQRQSERRKDGQAGSRCAPARVATASALHTAARTGCGFCSSQSHPAARCPELLTLAVGDRPEKIRNSGMCFRCLRMGHRGASCSARCENCKGKHHAVSCFKVSAPVTPVSFVSADHSSHAVVGLSEHATDVNLSCAEPAGSQSVVLPTASVYVKGHHGNVKATVLFDTGSNRSYVSSSLVRQCAPEWVETRKIGYTAFSGAESANKYRNIYRVQMSGAHVSQPTVVEVEAAEVPVICTPLLRPTVPSSVLASFGNLELADPPQEGRELSVDVLIGLDSYWQLMGTGCLRSDRGPVAQQTVFGWILSGLSGSHAGDHASSGHQLLVMSDVPESRLRQFWELDAIGISPLDEDVETDPVLKEFESSVSFRDGRYEVKLPWKQELEQQQIRLENNRKAAEVSLCSLDRKLEKDPQLQSDYNRTLEELEAEGIITEVSDEHVNCPVFYLPHRPVVRQDSHTTRVRPVFDASAKGPNLVSLNDCLETGPCLLPNLVKVLVRFRRWKYAVSADIRKAFLMIRLCDRDQEVHRFLWHHRGRIRTMKFCRVTFGVNCSPFLLSATLRHHLKGVPPSNTVTELEENMYVDDLLSGADTEEEACALFAEARDVLGHAGMTLTKLSSNSSVVLDKGPDLSSRGGESHKVLGVQWDPAEDVFSFEGVDVSSDIVTKRVILSFIARLFDPLGLLTPYTLTVKLLFLETWCLGLAWDDDVPRDIRVRFLK